MAQSAKDYAREQLGNLDLSYLNTERDVANKIYNTSKSSLENNFNNLINQINQNRTDARKNFNTGRATIAEDAFMANRQDTADLASKNVGLGGLRDINKTANRIETGRQYSNLANEFYDNMNELDLTEKQGRSQYDIDQQSIRNTLDQTLAGIGSREKDAINSYNMALGQLAETVQGRWDNNANAQATLQLQKEALAQQKAAQAQAHADAMAAAEANYKSILKQDLTGIVNNSSLSQDQKVAQITRQFNVDTNTAVNLLKQLDMYKATNDVDTGYNDAINYLYNIVGGW